jgi:hypothetical protein
MNAYTFSPRLQVTEIDPSLFSNAVPLLQAALTTAGAVDIFMM